MEFVKWANWKVTRNERVSDRDSDCEISPCVCLVTDEVWFGVRLLRLLDDDGIWRVNGFSSVDCISHGKVIVTCGGEWNGPSLLNVLAIVSCGVRVAFPTQIETRRTQFAII